MPTKAEDAAILRGIEQDPDTTELTDEFFASARPAREVLAPEIYGGLVRRRGPGRRPPKVQVTLRLEQDVVARLRASGSGWQVRVGDVLARMVNSDLQVEEAATVEATVAGPRAGKAGKGEAG